MNRNHRGSHNMDSVVDSYRLTPMQEGMLFQSLRADYAGVDVEQIVCRLREDLDIPILVRAWQRGGGAPPPPRTPFRWDDGGWPGPGGVPDASPPGARHGWR